MTENLNTFTNQKSAEHMYMEGNEHTFYSKDFIMSAAPGHLDTNFQCDPPADIYGTTNNRNT